MSAGLAVMAVGKNKGRRHTLAGSPCGMGYRLLLVRVDVIDGLLHGCDLFGLFIRNLAIEFLFQRHYQFDGVEGVGAQVVYERSSLGDFSFIYAQLLGDDLDDAFFNTAHVSFSSRISQFFDFSAWRGRIVNTIAGCKSTRTMSVQLRSFSRTLHIKSC